MDFHEYVSKGIHVGDGFHMTRAAIVGPYPTLEFVLEVLRYEPAEILLAIDDGWPQDKVEEIAEACTNACEAVHIRRVAPANGAGLVHAKLYCFEWTNEARNRRRHVMLAGSANASAQGFGGHAESYVHVDLANLDARDKQSVLHYFKALELRQNAPLTWFYISDKSWISLPALRTVKTTYPSGFDAWIRRGRLCHKYQADPNFGRLLFRLKQAMPIDLLGEGLAKSGFSVNGEAQSFSRPYVQYEEAAERQMWRQRYFTETDYGFWTSAECFAELSGTFVAPKADERAQAIDLIRRAAPQLRERWINEFTRSIESVFYALQDTAQREKYFDLTRNGELDVNRYRRTAAAKLARDRERAEDPYFRDRFLSGYSFPPVPQLGDEFDRFAATLCGNLIGKAQGGKVPNRLARVVRQAGVAKAVPATGEALLKKLRAEWQGLKPLLTSFHEADASGQP